MKPVVLAEAADAEALEAFAFYAGRSAGLGAEFTNEVEHALGLLAQHPELGPVVEGHLRRLLLRRFPYYLLYRIEEDRLLVLAVGHQSREPGYWRDRV